MEKEYNRQSSMYFVQLSYFIFSKYSLLLLLTACAGTVKINIREMENFPNILINLHKNGNG